MDPLGEHRGGAAETELQGRVGADLDYAVEMSFVDSKNATFHNEANWSYLVIEVQNSERLGLDGA